ncbi:PHD finger protein 21B isoform X5 [Macaca fascicularis]|uniref:PHD finger protein 21B isoform X5 n=1 Tax=Macaca fascicularis TaxID=9541 RepID=UPI003D15D411
MDLGTERKTPRSPLSERRHERPPEPPSVRLRPPPLLFSARGPGPRRGGSAQARAGRGRGAAGGGSRHRPPPPRPAPSGHCRISIVPRHNFAEAQRDPGARAGGNIVPAGWRLAREAAAAAGRARAGLRGAPGAGGPCAGPRRQPGDPAQLAGQPEELGQPRARRRGARKPFFPLASPLPFRPWGRGLVSPPPSPEAVSARARSGSREAAQLPGSPGQSERKVLPKLPGWSCRAGPRHSPWNSRATRTATSRSSSTKGSRGSPRSATNN